MCLYTDHCFPKRAKEDIVEDAKVNAMKDIAWKVHCMISEGKSIA